MQPIRFQSVTIQWTLIHILVPFSATIIVGYKPAYMTLLLMWRRDKEKGKEWALMQEPISNLIDSPII